MRGPEKAEILPDRAGTRRGDRLPTVPSHALPLREAAADIAIHKGRMYRMPVRWCDGRRPEQQRLAFVTAEIIVEIMRKTGIIQAMIIDKTRVQLCYENHTTLSVQSTHQRI